MTPPRPPMLERCGALREHWYAACLAKELGPGRPIARTLFEVQLALWRDASGRPRAARDQCLHRGALLSRGAVIDGCIACPYHGWMYDGGGRCVHVPSMGPGTQPEQTLRLATFPTREQDGLIWVWLGAGEPSEAPFVMPHWDTPGWSAYYMKTRFSNDVTNLVENFMDVPHTVFVHRGWFRTSARKRVPTTVARGERDVLVTYHAPDDEIGVSGLLLNPKRLPLVHTDHFFMPNHTRVDYVYGEQERAFIITSTCSPVSDMDTWVYTLISFKLGRLGRLARRWLPWYTRRVIEQDVDIMANQGRSFALHGRPAFHNTEADLLHEHIEALRGWEASGRVGPPPEPQTDEITMWI